MAGDGIGPLAYLGADLQSAASPAGLIDTRQNDRGIGRQPDAPTLFLPFDRSSRVPRCSRMFVNVRCETKKRASLDFSLGSPPWISPPLSVLFVYPFATSVDLRDGLPGVRSNA